MKNKSIALASINPTLLNESTSRIQIINSHSAIVPQLLALQQNDQSVLLILNWINAAIFTAFRIKVYKYLIKQYILAI